MLSWLTTEDSNPTSGLIARRATVTLNDHLSNVRVKVTACVAFRDELHGLLTAVPYNVLQNWLQRRDLNPQLPFRVAALTVRCVYHFATLE
jgi:hypothetical protein